MGVDSISLFKKNDELGIQPPLVELAQVPVIAEHLTRGLVKPLALADMKVSGTAANGGTMFSASDNNPSKVKGNIL